MNVLETLLPVILLIALGAGLARVRFLEEALTHELTRLVFWIALPALIFRSLATVRLPLAEIVRPLSVGVTATVLVIALGWVIGKWRGSPPGVIASMVQNGFRGNLAFIGLPVITYALADLPEALRARHMAIAFLIFGPLMVLYNVSAILVLLGAQHQMSRAGLRLMGRSILTNPLVIAAGSGFLAAVADFPMPAFFDRFLEALGAMAVPLALICIGASLISMTLHGRRTALWIGIGLKLAVLPLAVWLLCRWSGCTRTEQLILLIYAACPSAAAGYIMARQMGADADLSASGIALSTVLSFLPLSLILYGNG